MDTVHAYERRENKQAPKKQPLSLFDICTTLLWNPKTITRECHSLINNCNFCFLAANHLANEQSAVEFALGYDGVDHYFANNWINKPCSYFYLTCSKDLVKKFVILHILYAKQKITSDFTRKMSNTNFTYTTSFRGTILISKEISHLVTCYEIFILYLTQHLRWFSKAECFLPFNEVQKLKIACQVLANVLPSIRHNQFLLQRASEGNYPSKEIYIPRSELSDIHINTISFSMLRQLHKIYTCFTSSWCYAALWCCVALIALSFMFFIMYVFCKA